MSGSSPEVIRTVGVSPHQSETIRNMRDHPDCATRYDLVYLCSLSENVDLDSLRAAVGDLVRRHAALRTTVNPTTQRVHPAETFAELARSGPEESVASVVRELARGRHGLSDVVAGRPLFRAGQHLVVGDKGEVTLMSMKIHHLVYDGWSLSVIWRDLAELYRARLFGEQARLPVLRTTYADFTEACLRERKRLTKAAVDHWRAATADCPERIPWRAPTETAVPDTAVETAVFPLPDDVFPLVLGLARECRVSPFTVLLAVTGTAVAEVTGQDAVLVGNDDAARDDDAVQDVVGLFVDTRLTPVSVCGHRTIADLVCSISAAWRVARRYEVVQVDQILDAIGRPELVKVDLSAPSAPSGGLRLAGSEVTPIPVPWNTRYWRNLTVSWESGERAAVKIAFRPSAVHREVPREVVEAMIAVVARSAGLGQPPSGK